MEAVSRAPRLGGLRVALACAAALAALGVVLQPAPSTPAGSPPSATDAAPLGFVANAGQTDAGVKFMARGAHHAFYFTPDKAVLDFQRGKRGVALQLRFRGANPSPQIVAEQPTGARVSYFTGAQRHTGLAAYEQLRYRDLWPGIDMVFRGQGGALKYEFHVAAGAEPSDIRLAYAGADSLRLASNGSLAIATPLGTLRDAAPKTRQGARTVDSRYLVSGSSYGFTLGAYDRARALVIDPGLVWSTYLGGLDSDFVTAVETDSSGNAYVTGQTRSASFPTTPGSYDLVVDGIYDAFVSKLDGNGALLYSTYLGGSSDDGAFDLDVSGENAYVMGHSSSADFPTTPGAYDETLTGSGEYFVTKLNAAGSGLSFSTFVPGGVSGIAVDASGRTYVTGTASTGQIPVSATAPDTTAVASESFVERLNAAGSALDWATYVGGRGEENGRTIELDGAGEPYVVGRTTSVEQFPFTPGAYDTLNESESFFLVKVDAGGTAFDYATLLSNGINPDLGVDAAGHAYVLGTSGAPPTTPGAYDDDGCSWVAKMNPTGTALVYSTRLGNICNAGSLEIDIAGNAYVTQLISSGGLPTTPGAFDEVRNGTDVYLFKLNATGTGQLYGTYLGGSGHDSERGLAAVGTNSVVIGGYTESSDFPTTPGAHDQSYGGLADGFVTRLQTFDGYPRPKGATPLRLSLVMAYKRCGEFAGANRTHGPPLVNPSCHPPLPESSHITVGTADANGKPALNEGYLRFDTILGNPATPGDEADIEIEFFLDDVFSQGPEPLTDYTGELRLLITWRVIDRDVPNSVMSTIQDFFMPLAVQCVPTADPAEGSSCAANTTVGAIAGPVAINEGKRAIWQIPEVAVYDGGPDGDADTLAGNTVFARPGVFVP